MTKYEWNTQFFRMTKNFDDFNEYSQIDNTTMKMSNYTNITEISYTPILIPLPCRVLTCRVLAWFTSTLFIFIFPIVNLIITGKSGWFRVKYLSSPNCHQHISATTSMMTMSS